MLDSFYFYFPKILNMLVYGVFGMFVVLFLTPAIQFLAKKFNVLDRPSGHKLDKPPVPLLGGVAVYLGFLLTALFYQQWTPQIINLLLGGAIIVVLGTIDDIKPLSSIIRLIGQIIAALLVMRTGLIVSFMPDSVLGNVIAIVITLIWVLGIINAMNFLDGLDGLAGGVAVIASSFFFLIALYLGQYDVCLVSVALMGACLGFLFYNFKPARIYLGDGGSTFIGYILACIALYGGWSTEGPVVALGIPSIILGVCIFDIIYISLSRIKNGQVRNFRQWLDYVGKDHFHHRLMNLGFTERQAVVFIYLLSIILGLNVLVLQNLHRSLPIIVLLLQAIILFFIVSLLMIVGRKLNLMKENKQQDVS